MGTDLQRACTALRAINLHRVTVALREPIVALLSIASTGQATHLKGPSAAARQSRSSRAKNQRLRYFLQAPAGSAYRWSSVISVGWMLQPKPKRRSLMANRDLHHHQGHDHILKPTCVAAF
jgi:hypothetical protein